MSQHIPNEQLTLNVIPIRGAGWQEIVEFADTFQAYLHWEERWEHSDWSQGIPIAEYEEKVRRQGQPLQKVGEVAKAVRQSYARAGSWDASLTDLRTYLFAFWRSCHHSDIEPEDLADLYDLLDAIRAKVESGERE